MAPLSQQEISDVCSALFRIDTRGNAQRNANKRGVVMLGGPASNAVLLNPTAAEQAEILRSLATVAKMDDAAFSAIFFYHPLLPKVMRWLVLEAAGVSTNSMEQRQQQQQQQGGDNDQEGADQQPTSKDNAANLRLVIARCLSWQPSGQQGGDPAGVLQDPLVLCERLDALFPAEIITAVALLLARSAPLLGSVAITAWALQCPSAVATLSAFGGTWTSRVQELNAHCTALARRGRFERAARDVLGVMHTARALVLGAWALLHSCPFLVDAFAALPRIVAGARVVAEEISPALQHFVFTCDRLAPARPRMVRMIQKIANAAVDLAATAMIFSSHWSSANNSTFKDYIRQYDRAISEQVRDRGGVVARMLLRGTAAASGQGGSAAAGSVRDALAQVLPGTSLAVPDDMERLRGLREALPALEDPQLSGSSGSSGGSKKGHATFFAEQVLRRIAQQKVRLNPDDAPGIVLPKAANNPNSSSSASATKKSAAPTTPPLVPQSGGSATNTSAAAMLAGAAAAAECKYPEMIPLVCEILPQLGPAVAAKALDYYQGNMERLMDDAMSGNLPPHVANPAAAAASASAAEDAAKAAAKQQQGGGNKLAVPSLGAGSAPVDAASLLYDQQQRDGATARDADETLLSLLVGDFDATSSVPDDDDDDDGSGAYDNDDDDDDGDASKPPRRSALDDAYRAYGDGAAGPDGMRRVEGGGQRMRGMRATSSDDWGAMLPPLEKELLDKTRALMDRMYTDELDDAGIGNDIADVRPLNKKGVNMTALSDDDEDGEGRGGGDDDEPGGGGAAAAASGAAGDLAFASGSFFSGRMNQRKEGADGAEDKTAKPAYQRKPKSDWRKTEQRRHQQNAGGATHATKVNAPGKMTTKALLRTANR